MKRIRILTVVATLFTTLALAQQKAEVLNLFCWSEYVPTAVIKGFEKETGIKVNQETTLTLLEITQDQTTLTQNNLAGGVNYVRNTRPVLTE